MKKELYSVCCDCGKKIFEVKDCVEILISTKLYFINSLKKNGCDPLDEEFGVSAGGGTLCTECFFKKNSIKKAVKNRISKSTDLYELAQVNYNQNTRHFKEMKTKSKNKVLKKLIQKLNEASKNGQNICK